MSAARELGNWYKGWKIFHDETAPITGRWSADRHGVGMCANDAEMLKSMIDQRVHSEQAERDRRAAND